MIRLQQASFEEPTNLHQNDEEPIVIHARCRAATSLVLFVHGLPAIAMAIGEKRPSLYLKIFRLLMLVSTFTAQLGDALVFFVLLSLKTKPKF